MVISLIQRPQTTMQVSNRQGRIEVIQQPGQTCRTRLSRQCLHIGSIAKRAIKPVQLTLGFLQSAFREI